MPLMAMRLHHMRVNGSGSERPANQSNRSWHPPSALRACRLSLTNFLISSMCCDTFHAPLRRGGIPLSISLSQSRSVLRACFLHHLSNLIVPARCPSNSASNLSKCVCATAAFCADQQCSKLRSKLAESSRLVSEARCLIVALSSGSLSKSTLLTAPEALKWHVSSSTVSLSTALSMYFLLSLIMIVHSFEKFLSGMYSPSP
eukprot:CAMPEP_0206211776 /NCGR_PEP_ID=MMETSP0047_2-20121206/182_1 /ASSEMBLY_ACC=CAM_ASM_000192 /TAXON_ID=195065 /ORGANISM="Chroomonas mesostigmatica_cf, Strain CCMP1168" /LENGTH=201 /DNA_ID=CAMNT_0053633707 /DNA_START=202 /DNA_END=803 /DNA_ORIENTATION=-